MTKNRLGFIISFAMKMTAISTSILLLLMPICPISATDSNFLANQIGIKFSTLKTPVGKYETNPTTKKTYYQIGSTQYKGNPITSNSDKDSNKATNIVKTSGTTSDSNKDSNKATKIVKTSGTTSDSNKDSNDGPRVEANTLRICRRQLHDTEQHQSSSDFPKLINGKNTYDDIIKIYTAFMDYYAVTIWQLKSLISPFH